MQLPEPPQPRLKDRFVSVCRTAHLSLSTERQYWAWIRQFIKYHGSKSIAELTSDPQQKFSRFITAQAHRGVSASTQNQAWNALVFLYERVLGETLGKLPDMERAKRPSRLPNVPATHPDTMRILSSISGDIGLALRLAYGSALRVSEVLRIRLKDLDFERCEILIRACNGDKDGIVPLPKTLVDPLIELRSRREREHTSELACGEGWVWLPGLYGNKNPKAHYDTQWQYLFASKKLSKDPQTGNVGRHHIMPETLQLAMRNACRKLKIKRPVTPHGLRHASAREMERRGTPISEIQRCLRHSNVETTMRYLGAGNGGKAKVISPLD